MHQNWDQPPVAKASRRAYPQDLVDKGFLDFLLTDNIQLGQNLPPAPQQQSPFDLPYAGNALGAQNQTLQYNDGPYMSQQHTFQWVPTPGATDPVSRPDVAAASTEGLESVGHKHRRHEESNNTSLPEDFGLSHRSGALHNSGEHSGSDFEDNRKLSKAERTARMREKNKTAQKRWRDRQKAKLTDSEKKLAELSAKLDHLSIEKSALENRNNILEKVLVMRDQELGKFKAEDHAHLPLGEQQKPSLFTMQDGYRSNAYLNISVRDNARITCEALKNMPPQELTKLWKDYVNKLAVMLLEARGNDHSAVQAQIDNLVTECSAICASLAMSNPSAIRTMHCSNFDGAMITQQGPSSSKWLSISRSINLSPQQKKELLAGRHYYLTKLADVLRRRDALLANLEVLRRVKTTQHELAVDYVTVANAMEKLQANIQEDHQLICGFMYATWKKVLTLFQRGNVIVQSYPYFPDLVAVGNAIAADDHATAAEALLQQPPMADPLNININDSDNSSNPNWLVAPKQEDDFLCAMNLPLVLQ